MNSNIFGVTT